MTKSEIRPFLFCEDDRLAPVRVVIRDGEPWFVATDLARILGFRDAEHAVRHLDDDETVVETLGGTPNRGTPTPNGSTPTPGQGTPPKFILVSESGLYAVIFRSRKPAARKFRKWVTSEVLPAIRKTGRWWSPGSSQSRDLDRIAALLHQHQLRVYEAVNTMRGGAASMQRVANIAGLSIEAAYRHVALLALLGLLQIIPDDQLADLMGVARPNGRLH